MWSARYVIKDRGHLLAQWQRPLLRIMCGEATVVKIDQASGAMLYERAPPASPTRGEYRRLINSDKRVSSADNFA